MTEKKRGLGRGLGALIPSGPSVDRDDAPVVSVGPLAPSARPVAGHPGAGQVAHYAEIPVDAITPNPRQPRQVFDEEALAELVYSLREVGLLQPVVVRPIGDGTRYELIMGERRWRAAREAGFRAIPAI